MEENKEATWEQSVQEVAEEIKNQRNENRLALDFFKHQQEVYGARDAAKNVCIAGL